MTQNEEGLNWPKFCARPKIEHSTTQQLCQREKETRQDRKGGYVYNTSREWKCGGGKKAYGGGFVSIVLVYEAIEERVEE